MYAAIQEARLSAPEGAGPLAVQADDAWQGAPILTRHVATGGWRQATT